MANVFDIEPRAPLGALAGSYVLLGILVPRRSSHELDGKTRRCPGSRNRGVLSRHHCAAEGLDLARAEMHSAPSNAKPVHHCVRPVNLDQMRPSIVRGAVKTPSVRTRTGSSG
jgi:hypothetical protein